MLLVGLVVLAILVIPRLGKSNKPSTNGRLVTQRRVLFGWRWFQLRKHRKDKSAFFVGDDASSEAFLDPVWVSRRPSEVWMVIGEPSKGARRFLERMVAGLSADLPNVYYLASGKPPTHDEFWLLPRLGNWNIWAPHLLHPEQSADSKDTNRYHLGPLWFDKRVHSTRLWTAMRVWAATSGNAWQSPRIETLADMLAYLEALWPLICQNPHCAYEQCSHLFNIDDDANLPHLRQYLEEQGYTGGEWPARIIRTLGNRQSVETLSLLWIFLRRWAELDTPELVPLDLPGRWLCVFPEHFTAGASYAIEVLLATCKPGLIVLDRLGELLPPELYFEQIERLKRNGWSVLLCETSLGWVQRGDEGETSRIAPLVDNWLFGRLDGNSAAVVESTLGLQQEVTRSTVTQSVGLGRAGNNSSTQTPIVEPLVPARMLTSLPYDKVMLCLRFPPAWEPNNLRILSINS